MILTLPSPGQWKAARTPDCTALLGPALHPPSDQWQSNSKTQLAGYQTVHLSYKELSEKARQLADVLLEKGVQPGTIVGLMVERSLEMVTAILGILSAGGAYLPIDWDFQAGRINYMLADSSAPILVTGQDPTRELVFAGEIVNLASLAFTSSQPGSFSSRPASAACRVSTGHLVYVVYTSGSTGKPKGVMLEHRNLVNLVHHLHHHTTVDFSRVLQFATISFDASFQEIFTTLLCGGTVFLITGETRTNIPTLFRVIENNNISTLILPASFLKFIFNEPDNAAMFPGSIRHIITSAEQLVVTERLREYLKNHQVRVHNHYGPAETHVVTALTLDPSGNIPALPSIGKPLINTAVYIVGKELELLPIGVTGEMLIGGIQVGQGYLNNPQLTAEKFDYILWDYRDHPDEKINYKLQITKNPSLKLNELTRSDITTNKKFLQGGQGGAIFSKSAPPGRRRQL